MVIFFSFSLLFFYAFSWLWLCVKVFRKKFCVTILLLVMWCCRAVMIYPPPMIITLFFVNSYDVECGVKVAVYAFLASSCIKGGGTPARRSSKSQEQMPLI
jgi:hypothetical protein